MRARRAEQRAGVAATREERHERLAVHPRRRSDASHSENGRREVDLRAEKVGLGSGSNAGTLKKHRDPHRVVVEQKLVRR